MEYTHDLSKVNKKLKAINNFTVEDFRECFGSLCQNIPDDKINDILDVTKVLAIFAFDLQNQEKLREWKKENSKESESLEPK